MIIRKFYMIRIEIKYNISSNQTKIMLLPHEEKRQFSKFMIKNDKKFIEL
jgi:hypothetical protein